MLPYVLIGLAVLVVGFLVVAALQPAAFRVVRSAVLPIPPDEAFGRVNDFRQWEAWSPWAKLDPACANTFDGPAAGVGAGFAWSGNKKVGQGRMTITDSRAVELVRIRLEFLRPFKCTNVAEFTFEPTVDGQTRVTWAMTGEKVFVAKAFGLLMNMDKMIGRDFEKGLAQMGEPAGATPVGV